MTNDTRSGSVDIDAVRVRDRYRVDLGSLGDLSESIRDIGLLHPIVVTRDLRLVAGQRRLEACRTLGWSEIPATFVTDLDEASALLVAERDENTCRKAMTASELYALGKALEHLERPKARERQGARNDLSTSAPDGANVDKARVSEIVGPAVGMSRRNWQRLKHIGELAKEGDPVAIKILEDIDKGKQTVGGGYKQIRSGQTDEDLGNVGNKRSIPRKKQGSKQLRQLASKIKDLGNLVKMIDLDGLTKEEADSIAADLSQGLAALNSLRNQLRKVNP